MGIDETGKKGAVLEGNWFLNFLATHKAVDVACIVTNNSVSLALTRLESLPYSDPSREVEERSVEKLVGIARERREEQEIKDAASRNDQARDRKQDLRDKGLKMERDRIDAMLKRAQKARERRDYDEAILLCQLILKINRAEERAFGI